MKQPEDRYFLRTETDGSLSICDRHIVEAGRDHRIVTGLGQDQAAELIKKLNTRPGDGSKMSSRFEYPDHCPVAADLREALADGVEDMGIEDIKALLVYSAETLERQHEYLKFIHTSMKGSMTPGNA